MPSVFGDQRSSNRRGIGRRASLRDLEVQARELETFRQMTGARAIPQSKPGFFRTVVDALSRIEYAEAGAMEEFVQGVDKDGMDPGDFLAAATRAGREIFSGVGGLKGEKRGFSEALEKLGVGDLGRLSDAIPALEGTFFDVTGRGALGLVMGIAGDPLTYTGLGPVTKVGGTLGRMGGKVVAGAGEHAAKHLATRKGLQVIARETAEAIPRAEGKLLLSQAPEVVKEGSDILRARALDTIMDTVESAYKTQQGKARTIAAVKGGKWAQLSRRDGEILSKALGLPVKQRGHFRETLKREMDRLVEHEYESIVRQGISETDDIAADMLMIAQNQAQKRLIVAAQHTPGLLKKGRGITFLGREIKGTDKLTALLGSGLSSKAAQVVHRLEQSDSGLANTVAEATMGLKKTFDAFGSLFSRDFKTRHLPGYNMLKQAGIDASGAIQGKYLAEMQNGPLAKLARPMRTRPGKEPEQWIRVVRAVDEGTIDALQDPLERAAAEQMKDIGERMMADEIKVGLLKPEQVVQNYAAHFYHNTSEELIQAVNAWRPQQAQLASLGRHAEERVFTTLEEAVRKSKELAATHKNVKELRPIWDPVEIMRRRVIAHADGMAHQAFFEAVGREFGIDRIKDISTEAALKWVQPSLHISPKLASTVGQYADSRAPAAQVAKLPVEGRREFMRQILSKSKNKFELNKTLSEYAEFFDDLPQGGSLLGQIAEDGSRYVQITQRGLSNYEIPKTIADDIQGMASRVLNSKDMGRLLRGYTKLNNFFKTMVTVYFPSFHFRNAYSNVAQMFLDIGIHALDPRLHKHSVGVLAGLKGNLVDDMGRKLYDYDTVRSFIDRFGVKSTARAITEQAGEGTARQLVKQAKGLPKRARQLGTAVENEARTALFIQHLRRGLTPQQAAERVKTFLFDYENLSEFQKGMRLVIPFSTWTTKNIQLQVRQLLRNPGRTANLTRPFRGREAENNQMISWEGEALKLRLDRDGNTVRMLTGIDLPIKGLDIIWRGSVRETLRQNLGMISPLLKTPVEVATGVNLFTGRNLTRQQSGAIGRIIEPMPAPIKDWLGWRKEADPNTGKLKYSFDGERFYLLFQSYAFSRFVSTSDRAFRETISDGRFAAFMMDSLTGLRPKHLNLTEQRMRMLRERIRQTQRVLEQRGAGAQHDIFYDATRSKKRQVVVR